MRRFDKNDNIRKANMLAEQRYLTSKGLISESFHTLDETPVDVEEADLSTHKFGLKNTGNYPWTTYLGNKEKGESDKKQNIKDEEGFKNEFKKKYGGQTIETNVGTYTFFDIKFESNYGDYKLLFTRPPKDENEYSDIGLWIWYDPTNGYHIDNREGIKLNDSESEEKVKEMLSYNK